MIGMTERKGALALSELVLRAKDQAGSYAKLAARCTDPVSQRVISTSWLQRLGVASADPPEPWKLRALAVGLGRPLEAIKAAAAKQYFEYEATEISGLGVDAQAIVSHLGEMTEADVERLRRIVEAYGGG